MDYAYNILYDTKPVITPIPNKFVALDENGNKIKVKHEVMVGADGNNFSAFSWKDFSY